MAEVKISALSNATGMANADEFAIVQSGVTKRVTKAEALAQIQADADAAAAVAASAQADATQALADAADAIQGVVYIPAADAATLPATITGLAGSNTLVLLEAHKSYTIGADIHLPSDVSIDGRMAQIRFTGDFSFIHANPTQGQYVKNLDINGNDNSSKPFIIGDPKGTFTHGNGGMQGAKGYWENIVVRNTAVGTFDADPTTGIHGGVAIQIHNLQNSMMVNVRATSNTNANGAGIMVTSGTKNLVMLGCWSSTAAAPALLITSNYLGTYRGSPNFDLLGAPQQTSKIHLLSFMSEQSTDATRGAVRLQDCEHIYFHQPTINTPNGGALAGIEMTQSTLDGHDRHRGAVSPPGTTKKPSRVWIDGGAIGALGAADAILADSTANITTLHIGGTQLSSPSGSDLQVDTGSTATITSPPMAAAWDTSGAGTIRYLDIASGITFTPAGSIVATNVQAAIEEVDADVTAIADLVPDANGTTTTTTPGAGQVAVQVVAEDVQVLSGSGNYTAPTWATTVEVILWGPGGAGGSGRRDTNASTRGGGGGGASGNFSRMTFRRSDLSYPVAYVVGASGAGGAKQTGIGDGNPGSAGTKTTFGTYLAASAGGPGQGGTATDGGAGGTPGTLGMWMGRAGAKGGGSTAAGDLSATGLNGAFTSGGGGGGAGRVAPNTNSSPSAGAPANAYTDGSVAGGAAGVGNFAGATSIVAGPYIASGPGGGGSSNANDAGDGGAGYLGAGGGGGGHGNSTGGFTGGDGGSGGGGGIVVIARR